MNNLTLNDVSQYVKWDSEIQKFVLIKEIDKAKNIYLEEIKQNQNEDKTINITNSYEILLETYPFINNLKEQVVSNSIQQIECIKSLVFKSIALKTGPKIKLAQNDCKNANHQAIATRFISELNSFIYKYKVSKIHYDKVFIYLNHAMKFIGQVDLIFETPSGVYQLELKTSKVNFSEKYNGSLYLNKLLVENTNQLSIKDSFVLNPRVEQVYMNYNKPAKKIENKMISLFY
ncbi:hypothetical protein [Spiroplasma culicicola]|nr:hypothetical protein [Spiroplasma culicicola]